MLCSYCCAKTAVLASTEWKTICLSYSDPESQVPRRGGHAARKQIEVVYNLFFLKGEQAAKNCCGTTELLW